MLLTERVNDYMMQEKMSIRDFADAVHIPKRVIFAWLKSDLYLGDTSKARIETYLKKQGY